MKIFLVEEERSNVKGMKENPERVRRRGLLKGRRERVKGKGERRKL